MALQSWREMKFDKKTHASGGAFENEVLRIVQRYTHTVWKNVRIETLLTSTGLTEMDIVFYHGGVIYLLELKRVRRIVGEYARPRWTMYGWSGHIDEVSEYTLVNVIAQNNIHARSLMDLYHAEFGVFPVVLPVIIVPNDCDVSEELRNDVFTVQDLEDALQTIAAKGREDVAYRLAFLLDTSVPVVPRKDFVDKMDASGRSCRGKL